MLCGTFIIHGIAIYFGSNIGSVNNPTFILYSKIFTYISFLLFGIIGFIPTSDNKKESSLLQKLSNLKVNSIFIIALSIIIGEIGDKTFLASLGLGLQYPNYKLSLILGSISGMLASNSIAIFFGKFLGNKLDHKFIETLSNLIFIIFGLIGLISLLLK